MAQDAQTIEWLDGIADGEPGAAVGIVAGGEVVLRRCRGLASLEHGVPVTPRTRFRILSITKTFTAAAILVLAGRGALSLDDDVRVHLPELPPSREGTAPTVRHLLSMTSGLRDTLEIARLRGTWRPSIHRDRDLLDLAFAQGRRSFPEGERYVYTNVNFVLLAEILRRVSGQEADAFRKEVLYDPLGLRDTRACPNDNLVLPNLAPGYVTDGDGVWLRATDIVGISGDVLTSSLDDLLAWVLALRADDIGGVAVRSAMSRRMVVADGTAVYYGLGLALRPYRGQTILCHGGMQPGYQAHLAYLPEQDLGIVILANRDDARPAVLTASLLDRIVATFPADKPFRGRSAPAQPEIAGIPDVAGSYVDPLRGEWLSLAVDPEGVLVGETLGEPLYLYAAGPAAFTDRDDFRSKTPVRLDFAEGPDGSRTCTLAYAGARFDFERCIPPAYDDAGLEAFTGLYADEETGVIHRVGRNPAGELTVNYGFALDRALTFPMEAVHPDMFLVRPRAPGVDHRHMMRFLRDEGGAVTGVAITLDRLKGVVLTRRDGPGAPAAQGRA